jgi:hypothetical protein
MKKTRLFASVVLAFFPVLIYAQEIQLPSVEVNARQDEIPSKVKEAVLNDFGPSHQPFVWVTAQSIFDHSVWESNINTGNVDVYSYAIHTRTTKGDQLDALYSVDGKRISSREYFKNFRPSFNVINSLQNSEYKNWMITRDAHVIKTLANGTEKERYELVVKNGKEKKFLYFDKDGILLYQKNFALAEADW